MGHGYCGKILHVDLTDGSSSVEQPDDGFYRRYMGGKGFAGYYLNRMVNGSTDPLGSENVLVFATGVTGGLGPGHNRFTVAAKSPLTNGWGESEAGGFWAPELKFAGFDAVVIRGKALRPSYLAIRDDLIELRSADGIWGLDTAQAQEAIRADLGDRHVRIAQTGPAGERLVRFACIVNELRHFSGRGGLGAVMGSKNLRAIAVRGTGRPTAMDQEATLRLTRSFAGQILERPSTAALQRKGTPGMTTGLDTAGMLPTRNFRYGSFQGIDSIGSASYAKIQSGIGTCYGCPVKCKRHVSVDDERFEFDEAYGGPEYETIAAFGSACGVSDLAAIVKANELCSRCALDTISTGVAIAFAMECFEQGILTKNDTDGLELAFGNSEALIQSVEMIARREGFGRVLGEGIKRAAQTIGKGSEKYAMHVKGLEMALHEPRAKPGVGIGFALSDTGGDHIMVPHDPSFVNAESVYLQELAPLGILEPVDLFDLGPKKARLYFYTEQIYTLWKVLGICMFTYSPRTWRPLREVVEVVDAATGWDVSLWELLKVAERASALSRAFNARCGFGREDDWLPDRFFEPLQGGRLEGRSLSRKEFREAIDMVYEMKGWDPVTAAPTRAKLHELDLAWLTEMDRT